METTAYMSGRQSHGARGRLAAYLLLAAAAASATGCGGQGKAAHSDDITRFRQAGRRIDEAARAVQLAMSGTHLPLSAAGLSTVMPDAAAVQPAGGTGTRTQAEHRISFQVTGIVTHDRKPVVLTTVGMAGIGDEVDGFKVVKIGRDTVTFADEQGNTHDVVLKKMDVHK